MATTTLQRRPHTTALLPTLAHGIDQFQSNIRRMFENPFAAAEALAALPQTIGWIPPVEISESPNEVTISAELAGMDAKDVHVQLDGDVLTPSGRRASPAPSTISTSGATAPSSAPSRCRAR
jgi:HSP20 family protein